VKRILLITLGAVAGMGAASLNAYAVADTTGTASASCGTVQANGTAPCTGQFSMNVPVPTQRVTATAPVTTAATLIATSSLQPVGDPLRHAWTRIMDDEFNGTSIDRSKWVALNGWGNNNVTSNARNCTESGGHLILALPGNGTGCDLYSSQRYGAGAHARNLLVGAYLEARIWFPGPGTSPTSTLYNWPAFWAYDGSGNWLAGENDIAEALRHMEYNYSSNRMSGTLSPPGRWGNSWHVYGIYRAATQVQVFYDGVLRGKVRTNDDRGPEAIMFTSGKTNACCGAPTAYGAAGNVRVDWVREWWY
jgi:beta-glucanase (GH16 family)